MNSNEHSTFVHLRVHTEFSLGVGAISISDLARRCTDQTISQIGITDIGSLEGVCTLIRKTTDIFFTPIIGCDFIMKQQNNVTGTIALLCMNEVGYSNLLRLMEITPNGPLDISDLEPKSEGLVLLTGGAFGPIGNLLQMGKVRDAEDLLNKLSNIFPNRVYIELQRHGLDAEHAIEPQLIDLSRRFKIPLVATNQPYFLRREDWDAYNTMLRVCGTIPRHRGIITREHYLKCPLEMRQIFSDIPDACNNTIAIASICSFAIPKYEEGIPTLRWNSQLSDVDYLRYIATTGLEKRLTKIITSENNDQSRIESYNRQLQYELDVIIQKNVGWYFLFVADVINWMRNSCIPVGLSNPGAGSLVAWALSLTEIDPILNGLIFDRFINIMVGSEPLFSITTGPSFSNTILSYIASKIGQQRVARVASLECLTPIQILRCCSKAHDIPIDIQSRIEHIAGYLPWYCDSSWIGLSSLDKSDPEVSELIIINPAVDAMINDAEKLSKICFRIDRIMCDRYWFGDAHSQYITFSNISINNIVPTHIMPNEDLMTQVGLASLKYIGMPTFEFIYAEIYDNVEAVLREIRETRGIVVDLNSISLDDRNVYLILSSDKAIEYILKGSPYNCEKTYKMALHLLAQIDVSCLEELIVVIALANKSIERIEDYVERKIRYKSSNYNNGLIGGILDESLGVILYDEQIMRIAHKISGCSMADAGVLRRILGKRIDAEMIDARRAFIEGAELRGFGQLYANNVFNMLTEEVPHCTCKAWAADHALSAYQIAWLAVNFPVEAKRFNLALSGELQNN